MTATKEFSVAAGVTPYTIRNRYKDFHVYITRDRHSDSPYFIRHPSEGSTKQMGESVIIGWQKRKKETAEPNEVVRESNQTGFASLVDDDI